MLSFIRNEIKVLHEDFKNISYRQIVGCNCTTCTTLVLNNEQPSFYEFRKLQTKITNKKYFEECPNSNFDPVNIGMILSDVIIENAANDNIDSNFLHQLKEMGMSINQIKNENKIDMSDFGKATATSTSTSASKASAKNEVSIKIENILGETENLKEDIERELKIKKVLLEEIEYAKSDVEVFENALKEVEKANKENKELPSKSKSRLIQFWEDVSNKNSNINKTLKLLRKGKDYGVKLAKLYNNIPGVPSIPPIVLNVIDKL